MTRGGAWIWLALFALGCDDAAMGDETGLDARVVDVFDAARADAARADAARPDAARADAAAHDAAADAGLVLPATLAEAGLYADAATETLAADVVAFEPAYALWSDGATKRRFFRLPPGTQIDTSDMDRWQFPVGTKAFKEFARDGVRVETRLLYKTREGWFMVAFAWNAAQTEAVAVPDGVENALGTEHDIPAADDCRECHEGVDDALLGVSALQLSHDEPGMSLRSLVDDDRLSAPPAVADYRLPGGAAWDALGYLHANCGNCHNPSSAAFDRVDMQLWLPVAALADPTATPSHVSTVGVAVSETDPGYALRVDPGSPATSSLVHRMELRGDDAQMPPLASERADENGIAAVRAWIEAL